MKISMTLPTMLPGFDRAAALTWCRRIDEGPYHSLAVGERINHWNTDQHTTLSFAAGVTERVRIAPTIVILPAHPVVAMGKALATLDVLSGGRLTVGVGVGGREQDYRSLEKPFARTHQTLDDQVAALRQLWAGAAPFDGSPPVGPPPVQAGGPPILSACMGPRSIARSARWADGVDGFSLAPDTDDHAVWFTAVLDAWSAAGRGERPWLASSFWFALGADGADALAGYARDYMAVAGPEAADFMAAVASANTAERVSAGLARLAEAGCDEIFLVPTTIDHSVLDELAPLIAPYV